MTLPAHSVMGMIIAMLVAFLSSLLSFSGLIVVGIAAFLAYLSHYVLDAIQHWEKNQTSFWRDNKRWLWIATFIELLVAIGLYLVVWAKGLGGLITLIPTITACLPDSWHIHPLLPKLLPFYGLHEKVHRWQGNPKKKNEGPLFFQALFVGGFLFFILTRG